MESIDHIFTVSHRHTFNDIIPFYQTLNSPNKYLFTDLPNIKGSYDLKTLEQFKPKNSRAVFYLSYSSHINFIRHLYPRYKTVRMYHGIVMPWAKVLIAPEKTDVAICASFLDKKVWDKHGSKQRVEIIGWPRGERFFSNYKPGKINPKNICINSNWSKERSAFEICDRLGELDDYSITFTIHPHLEDEIQSPRAVEKSYYETQLKKLRKNVHVKTCPDGVLPHFKNQSLLLGVLSSSSFEWLIFNKPILFIRQHEILDFGPLIDNRPLRIQVEETINNEKKEYFEKRQMTRNMLMSHFDGKWPQRFNELADELEKELLLMK